MPFGCLQPYSGRLSLQAHWNTGDHCFLGENDQPRNVHVQRADSTNYYKEVWKHVEIVHLYGTYN